MTDAIRAAIEGASEYLAEHPDEARYTDSLATAHVEEGYASESMDRGARP